MTTRPGYSATQIALHWTILALIAWNWVFSDGMGEALDAHVDGKPVLGWLHWSHIGVGSAILILTLVRLTLRRVDGVPAPKTARSGWMDAVALLTHRLLYALLILVPALGLFAWFARVPAAGDIHVYAMWALISLIGLHALAALWHQFVLRDGLIRRMLRPA